AETERILERALRLDVPEALQDESCERQGPRHPPDVRRPHVSCVLDTRVCCQAHLSAAGFRPSGLSPRVLAQPSTASTRGRTASAPASLSSRAATVMVQRESTTSSTRRTGPLVA